MTAPRLPAPLRALAALAVGFGLGGASTVDIPKIPVRLAFAADSEGSSAETLLDVRDDALYAVNLTFRYDEAGHPPNDRDRVWHLVGGAEKDLRTGQWQDPGAPLTLEVVLRRQGAGDETDILRQKVVQPRLSSWGAGTLTARLGTARLSPGRYHLVVRSLHAAPTLRDVPTCIGVARAYAGK